MEQPQKKKTRVLKKNQFVYMNQNIGIPLNTHSMAITLGVDEHSVKRYVNALNGNTTLLSDLHIVKGGNPPKYQYTEFKLTAPIPNKSCLDTKSHGIRSQTKNTAAIKAKDAAEIKDEVVAATFPLPEQVSALSIMDNESPMNIISPYFETAIGPDPQMDQIIALLTSIAESIGQLVKEWRGDKKEAKEETDGLPTLQQTH